MPLIRRVAGPARRGEGGTADGSPARARPAKGLHEGLTEAPALVAGRWIRVLAAPPVSLGDRTADRADPISPRSQGKPGRVDPGQVPQGAVSGRPMSFPFRQVSAIIRSQCPHPGSIFVIVHGVGSLESGGFDSRGPIGRSEGARAPTEPSGTTMSDRPARRRPGRRNGVSTVTIGASNRLPGGHSVPPPARRPITACRPAHPLRRTTRQGLDITSSVGSS
jgi:hypothetical protein